MIQPFEEDFCKAAYEVGGQESSLVDAWSGGELCNQWFLAYADFIVNRRSLRLLQFSRSR
jgi:hypothetical protein